LYPAREFVVCSKGGGGLETSPASTNLARDVVLKRNAVEGEKVEESQGRSRLGREEARRGRKARYLA
jgi:hypothetical protein